MRNIGLMTGGMLILTVGLVAGCRGPDSREVKAGMNDGEMFKSAKLTGRQIADLKFAMGRSHEQRGDEQQARIAYQQAIEHDPKRGDACLRLAILHDKLGKFRESEELYRKALAAQPGNPDIFCNMGYSCYLQRRWADAEMNLRQAVALDTSHARAHNNLGLVLAHTGKPQDALLEFMKGGCQGAEAHLNVAYVLAMEGDVKEAANNYRLAEENPATRTQAKKGLQLIEHLVRASEPSEIIQAQFTTPESVPAESTPVSSVPLEVVPASSAPLQTVPASVLPMRSPQEQRSVDKI